MFAEWLEAKLAERGWSAADLTAASRDETYPRGLDSGLISRWRRKDAQAVVPTQAKTLARLAKALSVPESEAYQAAGLAPADLQRSPLDRVEARRQVVRDQLDRWLSAVGPDYEQEFWDYLKTHGDSGVELIQRIRTAVNAGTEDVVNAVVSARGQRRRKHRKAGGGPLTTPQHTSHPVSAILDVGSIQHANQRQVA